MVNVADIPESEIPTGVDRLEAIFGRQCELMEKYHPIEKGSGLMLCETIPVDLHDKRGQHRLKDFAWRITEELGEALEALHKNTYPELYPEMKGKDPAEELLHYAEEIADGLHFLTEFTLLSGMTAKGISVSLLAANPNVKMGTQHPERFSALFLIAGLGIPPEDLPPHKMWGGVLPTTERYVGKFIMALGTTCNCLKNKPWKQTHMLTDEDYYRSRVIETWVAFVALCSVSNLSSKDIFDLYFKKSGVNKFRIRSNY